MVVADVKELLSLIADLYARKKTVNENDEELVELIDNINLLRNVIETKLVSEEGLKRYKRLFVRVEKLVTKSRNPIRRWMNARHIERGVEKCNEKLLLYASMR